MARAALNRSVQSGQRETRGAVVEYARGPGGDRMAGGALRCRGWKARGHVVGHVAPDGRGAHKRRGVAAIAIRRTQRVVVIDVALRAGRRQVRPHQREACDAVIERRGIPSRGGMAIRAVRRRKRRSGGRVHRIIRALPGGQVALRVAASRGRDLQRVVPVDMARAALHGRMLPGQRETRGAVVKHARGPGGNRMAGGALHRRGWKARRYVIRNISADGCGAHKGSGMAAVTIRGTQRVVVIDVALRAGRGKVRPHQCKTGGAVVKRRHRVPACRSVAVRAIADRKGGPRSGVHGIICALVVLQVALRVAAIGRLDHQRIVVVDVAGRARHLGVQLRQRETRGAVVKCRCGVPPSGGVAIRAVARGKQRPSR